MNEKKTDIVILAGGPMDKELESFSDAPNKGFIDVAGIPMVEYVVDAAKKSRFCGRVILAAQEEWVNERLKNKVDQIARPGDSMVDSLKKAVGAIENPTQYVLVMPCDVALVTGEAIDDFIGRSLSYDPPIDISYGFLSKEDSEAKFPDVHHTYIRTADGTFCGTGFFLMDPKMVNPLEEFFQRLVKNRKNPIALVGVLGFGALFQLLIGTITVKQAEARVLEIMGGYRGKGVQTSYAEAGFNVDAPNELNIARKILSQKTETIT